MAIIDLPTTQAFKGAQFSLALDVSESTYTGFLTGNRTRTSNLADRLRGTLLLPPVLDPVAAAAREALLMGMRSNGDWLRFAMPHRKVPNGSMRGSTVLSASAAAGARSVSISGALSGANLLANGGFEIDTNGDGVADGWQTYTNGASTGAAWSLVAGNSSPTAQRMAASTLGSGGGDLVGVARVAALPVTAGQLYSLSADFTASGATFQVELYADWLNSGAGVISTSRQAWPGPIGWERKAINGALAPVGAVNVRLYAWIRSDSSGGAVQAYVDNFQWEAASAATPYTGLAALAAGDWLGIGGNLIQVAYAGATGTDAGALASVPLSMPLPKAVSSGAAVTWQAPTGLWELDDDGIQLDYSAGGLQAGFAIPLRQVAA